MLKGVRAGDLVVGVQGNDVTSHDAFLQVCYVTFIFMRLENKNKVRFCNIRSPEKIQIVLLEIWYKVEGSDWQSDII